MVLNLGSLRVRCTHHVPCTTMQAHVALSMNLDPKSAAIFPLPQIKSKIPLAPISSLDLPSVTVRNGLAATVHLGPVTP